MSEMSQQRKNLVMSAAGVVCMAAGGPTLTKGYPRIGLAWVGFVLMALVYTVVQFLKWRRSGSR